MGYFKILAAIPGFFLSSLFFMLLWDKVGPRLGLEDINYGTAMLVTIKDLSEALNCTEHNIRLREGHTLPRHIAGRKPRQYYLSEVLWAVAGQEREAICSHLGLDIVEIKHALTPTSRDPFEDYDSDSPEDPVMW